VPKQSTQLHLGDHKCVLLIQADLWNGFAADL